MGQKQIAETDKGILIQALRRIFCDAPQTLEYAIRPQTQELFDTDIPHLSLVAVHLVPDHANLADGMVATKARLILICIVHSRQLPFASSAEPVLGVAELEDFS